MTNPDTQALLTGLISGSLIAAITIFAGFGALDAANPHQWDTFQWDTHPNIDRIYPGG